MWTVLTACAGWTLLVALVNAVVCPFFRGTRQGLLAVHWTAVNTLVAWGHGGRFAPIVNTLIPSSALLLLLDTRRTALLSGGARQSKKLRSLQDYVTALRDIFVLDAIGLAVSQPIRLVLQCSLVVGLILVGLHLYLRRPTDASKLTPDDLDRIAHEDMFVNQLDPFQVIGRLGRLDYLCIVALAVCDMVQLRTCIIVDLLTLLRSIATLSLLFTPAFFGGAVQSVKTTGRTMIALRASIHRFVKFM